MSHFYLNLIPLEEFFYKPHEEPPGSFASPRRKATSSLFYMLIMVLLQPWNAVNKEKDET